jgi:hypothetical protein
MFSQNSISKELQDSIRKIMDATSVDEALKGKQANIDKNNNGKIDAQDFKLLKSKNEATKVIVHGDEAQDKKLVKKMMNTEEAVEEVEQQNEAKSESKKDFQARQERLAAAAAQTAKDPARLKRMMSIPGYSAAMGLANKTTTKEEVEELDELSRTTLGSYAKKATRDAVISRKIGADFEHQGNRAKSPGMKAASDMLSQRYKAKSFKRRDGVDSAVNRLVKEDAEQFDETVLVHATYEIKDSYTFSEYLTTAKNLVGDEDAVELANEAFKVQDTDIFAEELGSMDVMARINSHRKAGHTVTEPKYSTKAGKPYHEYVVTDKETGTRRKYIHHGSVSKVENMGAKPKKDEQ